MCIYNVKIYILCVLRENKLIFKKCPLCIHTHTPVLLFVERKLVQIINIWLLLSNNNH